MKRVMAVTSSLTEVKEAQWIACLVTMLKDASTRLSLNADLGVKCRLTRSFRSSHALMSVCLWVRQLSTTRHKRSFGLSRATLFMKPRNSAFPCFR